MVELLLDRFQIVEDVGMIKLKVVEDQRTRAVMHKFRTFIKERAVVLIRFDNKERPPVRAETSKLPGTPPITKPGLRLRTLPVSKVAMPVS